MAAVLVFAGLALFAVFFTVAVLGILLKLAIRLILFPLFLIKWIVTALVMLIVGPILAVVGLVLAVVFTVLLAVPLLPLVVLGLIVWALVSSTRRPAAA
jgi:hypothetical protein